MHTNNQIVSTIDYVQAIAAGVLGILFWASICEAFLQAVFRIELIGGIAGAALFIFANLSYYFGRSGEPDANAPTFGDSLSRRILIYISVGLGRHLRIIKYRKDRSSGR